MIKLKRFFQNNQQKLQALEKENAYYQKVAEDLSMGEKDEGMWSKAFSKSKGGHKETESIYIKLMVEKIIIEERLKEEAEEKKKKEEEKIDKERYERERLQKKRERQKLYFLNRKDVAKLKKERKEKKSKRRKTFMSEIVEGVKKELPMISIISTGIFFLEMKGITTVFTPWFSGTINNLPLWNFLLFVLIVILILFLVICTLPFRKS